MTRIELSDGALSDLDRVLDHLLAQGAADAGERVAEIVAALDILRLHPRIGRPAGSDMRELVIGRDARGYVALYRYRAEQDVVSVAAFRAQREAGYGDGR